MLDFLAFGTAPVIYLPPWQVPFMEQQLHEPPHELLFFLLFLICKTIISTTTATSTAETIIVGSIGTPLSLKDYSPCYICFCGTADIQEPRVQLRQPL